MFKIILKSFIKEVDKVEKLKMLRVWNVKKYNKTHVHKGKRATWYTRNEAKHTNVL